MDAPQDNRDDPLLGSTLAGRYRIESVLGEGGVCRVYLARQAGLERPVAVKVLRHAFAQDPNYQARFRREARAASLLDHPNIIQILDYDIAPDGVAFIAMELLDGRTLLKAIYEDWPLGTERIVAIVGRVLAALATAHDAGIIHRDLKPENIMLVQRPGDDGRPVETVKVTDFGIAKPSPEALGPSANNLTAEGMIPGTPEYMSPEHARGEALDGRSDLYAVGAILYEMLSGTLPFSADTPMDVIVKQLTEAVEPPSARRDDVDPRLEAIALRALAKDRDERYPDARAMRAALEAVAPLRSSAPHPRSDPVPLQRPRARTPSLSALGIVPRTTRRHAALAVLVTAAVGALLAALWLALQR